MNAAIAALGAASGIATMYGIGWTCARRGFQMLPSIALAVITGLTVTALIAKAGESL